MLSDLTPRPKTKRNGWYDGWFYATIIDTKHSVFRNKILEMTGDGEKIVDIGCGTGGLSLELAKKSVYVLGVDLSESQIAVAMRRKAAQGLNNIDFLHANAAGLSAETDVSFDRAIFVLMLHEIPFDERLAILREIKKRTQRVTILDYDSRMPLNFWGVLIRIIEFFAGRSHYRHFRHFIQNGGLPALLEQAGYAVETERGNKWRVFQLVTARSV